MAKCVSIQCIENIVGWLAAGSQANNDEENDGSA